MTNKLKGMTRQVRLTVQFWWLNREVDHLAGRIDKGLEAPAETTYHNFEERRGRRQMVRRT
jgi:hypothetical protein